MVSIGLLPGEMVLRGGGLPAPVVLSGLREVSSRCFVALNRKDTALHLFLTGQAAYKRALGSSAIWAALTAARNEARLHAFRSAVQTPGEDDNVEDLGLDDPSVCKKIRLSRQIAKADVQIPESAQVEINIGDRMWSVWVLLDDPRLTVSMEASAHNFETLREVVLQEMAAPAQEMAALAPADEDKRSPKGPRGRREYWRKDRHRWVMITPVEGADAAADDHVDTTPPKKRYLSRWPTDEAPAPKQKRNEGGKPCPAALAAPPLDCLSDL